jgi:energy-converting hydrogenase Eha subunit A
MKLIAHDIFAFGLGTYVLAQLGAGIVASVTLALFLSVAVNRIIDAGHYQKKGRPARSYITHSLFTAPIWGLLAGLAISSIALFVLHVELLLPGAIAGTLAAFAHLFLDSLIEGGIFLWKKRMALAHFRYDNALANGLAIAVGILFLLLAAA